MALKLFKQAARADLPEAVTILGTIYDSGGFTDEKSGQFYPLVRRNTDLAVEMYAKAASSGDDDALNYIGAFHFNKNEDKR